MQAIQSIESAAMEIPRRSSPFRALVWKEWRQQRWIFLSLAGLTYAVLASALIVNRYGSFFHDLRNEAASVLGGCALLLGIASVVVLSANAFSGEGEDNTDQFLATIPCSRSKLFQVKLGFVLFLVLLGVSPLGAAALVQQPHDFVNDFKESALVLAADGFVLAIVPALVASFGGSVIATILASVPVVAACWAYMYSPAMLAPFVPIGSKKGEAELLVLYAVLMLATLLLVAWRMWIRVERTWRSSLRTSAAAAGVLIAYVALPVAATYFYVTLFAPLNFFLNRAGDFASGRVCAVSPDGRHVILGASYRGWGSGGVVSLIKERAAFTDVDSGRTRWLTRFHQSFVWQAGHIWSPSGNQFVMQESGQWLWPFARGRTYKPIYFVMNAQSGEKRSLDDLCPGLPQMPSDVIPLVGWYDEQVFALQNGRDIFFADIEHHQFRMCKMPDAILGEWLGNPFFSCRFTQKGIFAVPESASAKGELRVLRYAPDLAEAETLTLHNVHREWPYIAASEDGRWLLLNDFVNLRQQNVWRLARLADDAEATLLVSEDAAEKGLIPPSWRVVFPSGFLPGGHQILLYGGTELGLFDADSHDLRRIPLTQADGKQIVVVKVSPAGRFALVWFGDPATRDENGGRIVLVDLSSGQTVSEVARIGSQFSQWLGEDRLLSENYGRMPRVINRDGTGERPLLAK